MHYFLGKHDKDHLLEVKHGCKELPPFIVYKTPGNQNSLQIYTDALVKLVGSNMTLKSLNFGKWPGRGNAWASAMFFTKVIA